MRSDALGVSEINLPPYRNVAETRGWVTLTLSIPSLFVFVQSLLINRGECLHKAKMKLLCIDFYVFVPDLYFNCVLIPPCLQRNTPCIPHTNTLQQLKTDSIKLLPFTTQNDIYPSVSDNSCRCNCILTSVRFLTITLYKNKAYS